MGLPLTLNLAAFSASAQLPDAFLAVLEERIAGDLGGACAEHLQLRVVKRPVTDGFPSSDGIAAALELHEFARALNRNRQPKKVSGHHDSPVESISAIFADRYESAMGVLGIMFDRGFTTDEDRNAPARDIDVPREACAIFVEEARWLRGNEADTHDEIWFTTTHEIGHIFNLQHTPEQQTFLSYSGLQPFRFGTVEFSQRQIEHLQRCDSSRFVWPGGARFGETDPALRALLASSRQRMSSPRVLSLEIDLSQREFFRFEPVELDVTVRLASDARRSVHIPNIIDPGYEQFRIWIETPGGERRLYRSPRHYCSNSTRLKLAPGEAFMRDISIFGESGGLTFREPGMYRLHAELDLGRHGLLRSNVLDARVLPNQRGHRRFDCAFELFGHPAAAWVLYHRMDRSGGRDLARLELLCDRHKREPGVEMVRYALGRAWLQLASRTQDPQFRRRAQAAGVRQLRLGLRRKSLGQHRIARAQKILEQLRPQVDLRTALWSRPCQGSY